MLEKALKEYAQSNMYPFHMPGHKRKGALPKDAYQIDITEIDGFDNLHQPEDVLLSLTREIETLYKSHRSFMMVNGSTGGNLAAIFAATTPGGEIIIGRNCHKSVYHGAELRGLKVHYTIPLVENNGMVSYTPVEEYERAIKECPKAQAIVVTSPTYEGKEEPLKEICALAHKHHIPVIVDAAHGAHVPFHASFLTSPLEQGADVVIMSLHKTLPALTQTAMLHMREGSLVKENRIKKYLTMFQTSSPSYVLMTSISQCVSFLKEGKDAFAAYAENLEHFYKKMKQLKRLKVEKGEHRDVGKIVIDTSCAGMTGYELQKILREKYEIELEMASFCYALAMSSVADDIEGFQRLEKALLEIDDACKEEMRETLFFQKMFVPGEKCMELAQAAEMKTKTKALADAKGEVAGAMVAIYPPAIPLLVPGERISADKIEILQRARRQGLIITGMEEKEHIQVIVN